MGKMKKALREAAFMFLLAAVTAGVVLYATSAKVWYAGEHTADCNRGDNCGCAAKLVEVESVVR
jgi:hypothetical protein